VWIDGADAVEGADEVRVEDRPREAELAAIELAQGRRQELDGEARELEEELERGVAQDRPARNSQRRNSTGAAVRFI
jgi:hypothetical protein